MRRSDAWTIEAERGRPARDGNFERDALGGLTRAGQKEIPAKYLYDDVGSALFDVITLLPEYGLTRADIRLLRAHAGSLHRYTRPSVVIELGSGGGGKAGCVLEQMGARRDIVYSPVDLSESALKRCRQELAHLEGVRVVPILAQYIDGLQSALRMRQPGTSILVLFLGSSIGNFTPPERRAFLGAVRNRMARGDWFLLSTDLRKDPARTMAAYNDPIGATAAFNLNVLARINRELGGDFDLANFEHVVRYDSDAHRIEMHLRSRKPQIASVQTIPIGFREGETIWTESSYKFSLQDVQILAEESGFCPEQQWVDEQWPFALSLFRAV